MLSLLVQAQCLVIRPPHAPAAARGTAVEIIPLEGGATGPLTRRSRRGHVPHRYRGSCDAVGTSPPMPAIPTAPLPRNKRAQAPSMPPRA